MDVLELWDDPDCLRKYQTDVPFVHVPTEIIEKFFDYFDTDRSGPDKIREVWDVLSDEEFSVVAEFEQLLEKYALKGPAFDHELDAVLKTREYGILREAAKSCLLVFEKLGRLSEEVEEWYPKFQ